MGFFRKFQKKKNGKESKSKDAEEEQQQHNKDVAASSNSRRSYLRQKSMTKSMDKATMENVPSLIEDLQSVSDTSDEKTLKVLRKLFALSEHQKTRSQDNRTQLVHVHQRLVPALLQLLINCPRGSSEQYLTLLVLNNLSIPDENKHVSTGHLHIRSDVETSTPWSSCSLTHSLILAYKQHLRQQSGHCIRAWRS